MISINPTTEEVIKTFNPHTDQEVDEILKKSYEAYLDWRGSTITERKVFNIKLKELLKKRRDELASLMTTEMGKPISQSYAEIDKCCWALEYYAEKADTFLSPQLVETESQKSYVRFDPLGIILAIMPWNFPFWQVFRFSAPSVVAGNSALLKHASNVSMCSLAIEELYAQSGFPKNLFRSIIINGEKAVNLLRNPLIKAATLTGSEFAGISVATEAGKNLKKVVLELGGSDPFIVLKDADIEKAAFWAAKARTINNGQSCIAAKRFIVVEDIYEKFKESFVEEMKKLKVGDPMDAATDLGPIARKDLLDEIEVQVKQSVSEGAKILLGGKRIDSKGYFYPPTILENVTPQMTCFKEEIFAPVAPLINAKDDKDAVELANNSRFGLGASIWTMDLQKAEEIAVDIEVGTVFINGIVKSDPRLPFGGVKASGFGRELSYFGIREFVNIKSVTVEELQGKI